MKNVIIFILMVFIKIDSTLAQSHILKMDDLTTFKIDSVVGQVMQDSSIVGMAIGVLYDRQIVYTQSYGWAEESVTSFAADTKVRWASISKTITAILSAMLWESGDLNFNSDVTTYVPDFDTSGLLLRDLLHHQSGIEHYSGNCGSGYSGAFVADDTVDDVNSCNNCFTPAGSAQLYTSFGSNLIGAAINNIGDSTYNKDYYTLFKDWLKTPLNLSSLDQDSTNTDPLMAVGYSGPGIVNTPLDVGWKLPSGGFYSNIIDISKYCESILNYELLDRSTFDTIWTIRNLTQIPTMLCDSSVTSDVSTNPGFGMQFSISTDVPNTDIEFIATHTGANELSSTMLWMKPNKGIGLTILCNTSDKGDELRLIRNSILQYIDCPQIREFTTDRSYTDQIVFEADSLIEMANNLTVLDTLYLDAPVILLKQGFMTGPIINNTLIKILDDGCGGLISPGN